MKTSIQILKQTHRTEWLKTRSEVENEVSSGQLVLCVCGRLATGLHERNCKKFNNLVDKKTCKKLIHLIKN